MRGESIEGVIEGVVKTGSPSGSSVAMFVSEVWRNEEKRFGK